jgi:hypothetical protein
MSYALYELALHPEVQSRLREEITQVLDKHQGELTYEGMNEMSYLDMVVSGEEIEARHVLWNASGQYVYENHPFTVPKDCRHDLAG